jgi:hypothetical protein
MQIGLDNTRDIVLHAFAIDDIPLDTSGWLVDQNETIRHFTVDSYRCPALIKIRYEDGSLDYLELEHLKFAVTAFYG